jgi:hypothetical protein
MVLLVKAWDMFMPGATIIFSDKLHVFHRLMASISPSHTLAVIAKDGGKVSVQQWEGGEGNAVDCKLLSRISKRRLRANCDSDER